MAKNGERTQIGLFGRFRHYLNEGFMSPERGKETIVRE